MGSSCYVGCKPPTVHVPTGHPIPSIDPHIPLAFTGAGPDLSWLLAVGFILFFIGLVLLIAPRGKS